MSVAAPSAAAGLDDRALDRLHAALTERVASRRIPGAVYQIERRGARIGPLCVGRQDPQRGLPMRADSIFRIYSMTKPVVSVAVMMLVEQGRLLLRDPVARYLQAFADTGLGTERDAVLDAFAARRPITVHDLLRHTAGLTYEWHEATAVRQRYLEAGLNSRQRSNAQLVDVLAGLPLQHEPGSIWDYSRATDVLGRLIEVIADRSLGEQLQATVFEPLGMVDTGFAVHPDRYDRLAEPFQPAPVGTIQVPLYDTREPARLQSGGGGLLSTAADYARFLRMLLGGGALDGSRLLGRKTVEHMTADHLGTMPRSGALLPNGHGFGLGVAVKTALGQDSEPGSVGSYGWSGAAGTAFFVDPQESMLALILTQAPDQLDEVRELFRGLVYAAIDT